MKRHRVTQINRSRFGLWCLILLFFFSFFLKWGCLFDKGIISSGLDAISESNFGRQLQCRVHWASTKLHFSCIFIITFLFFCLCVCVNMTWGDFFFLSSFILSHTTNMYSNSFNMHNNNTTSYCSFPEKKFGANCCNSIEIFMLGFHVDLITIKFI